MKSRSPNIGEGQLDSERVAHLLEATQAGRLTARLWFETEGGMGQVDFCRGYIVGASMGPVSGRAALGRLLSLSEGRYRVVREDVPEAPPLVPDVQWLLDERARRQTQWRWLCEQAPPMSSILVLTPEGRRVRSGLHGIDRLVLPLADGHRTLADVLTESNIDPVEALTSVVTAIESGLLGEIEQRRSLFPLTRNEHAPHSLPAPARLPRLDEEDTPRAGEVRPIVADVPSGTEKQSANEPRPAGIRIPSRTQELPASDARPSGQDVPSGTKAQTPKRPRVSTRPVISVGAGREGAFPDKIPWDQDDFLGSAVPGLSRPSRTQAQRLEEPMPNPTNTPPPETTSRRQIGLYELLLRIGGLTGSLYVCRPAAERGFGRLLALKLADARVARDQAAMETLLALTRQACRLNHPNLVRVHATGLHEARPYRVMDYVEGASLERLLTRAPQEATVPRVLATIIDALSGLHAMHELPDDQGSPLELVHGDVAPETLLVGVDGRCRLTGLGVPQRVRATGYPAQPGRPGFYAPEQVLNRPIDRRTDVFAMGAALWSALTGQRLFAGRSAEDTVRQVCHAAIPPPSHMGLRPPAALDGVCLTALQREPEKRFPTAEHMAVALREAAAERGLLTSADEVATWVRIAMGRELAERRLLILDASRASATSSWGRDESGQT